MSLIDAFLLDPARINVWVAIRGDGSMGTVTQMDPWNAAFNNTTSYTPTAITRVGTTATVALTAHPFKPGNRVLIAGATGADGLLYNGSFVVATTRYQFIHLHPHGNSFVQRLWNVQCPHRPLSV